MAKVQMLATALNSNNLSQVNDYLPNQSL